jgi:DNA (cytosine-5)-methyltransferase 1
MRKQFAEFFAGGGMVSKALASSWECTFANDFDPKKADAYRKNHHHAEVLLEQDITNVRASDINGSPLLVWGSSPCQDLSVAGKGAGLKGGRSGTYFQFWRVIDEMIADERQPEIVAVENVVGSLRSNSGNDFTEMCKAFHSRGYVFGAMVVDAVHFVPQSRPRLFIVGVKNGNPNLSSIVGKRPLEWLGGKRIKAAFEGLPKKYVQNWVWWDLPAFSGNRPSISKIIQRAPSDVCWHEASETQRLISMMSDVNLQKLDEAATSGRREIGFVYKRTRRDEAGRKVQRAEVRFDGVAGCLRTPGGGSSRQLIVEVNGSDVRSRLLGVREAARLMGLDDSYKLPKSYNEGYHIMGDGVAVPVVKYLDNHLFSKLLLDQTVLMAAE